MDILETLCKEKLPPQAFPKPDEKEESSDEENEMMNDEEGGNYEEITEQMIDVKDILNLYASPDILSKVGLLLREYEFNKPEVNRAICKLLHRVSFDLKMPAMCYQATIFFSLQKINQNQGLVKSNPVIHELWRFGKYLLGEFFKLAAKNHKLPLEVLFWTKGREVDRIQDNHYEREKLPAKSSVWTDEAEDELRQLVSEAQRDLDAMENGPDIPITDWIVNYVAEQFTSDDTKTTDQLRRRMMKMGLIQKIQKRPKSSATIERREPREVHRSPKRVGSVDYEALPIQDINTILERLVFTPTMESTLRWLQAEMTDEIKDRTEEKEDDWIDRALVTSELKVSAKLENYDFRVLLKSAGFQYPNHEHVYWRIPTTLSVNELEYFNSMLNDYEPRDDQMKDISDVEMAPDQEDSSDDDFDKMMNQMRSEKRTSESDNSPKPRKVSKMKNDDFVRAVNQSDSEPENRPVNSDESDSDEELGGMLREAEIRKQKDTAKIRVENSDEDSDQENMEPFQAETRPPNFEESDSDEEVTVKTKRRTVLESSDED